MILTTIYGHHQYKIQFLEEHIISARLAFNKHNTHQEIFTLLLLCLILQNLIQLMKNEEFQVKLLIKQNTEMVAKLQHYRRENQELTIQNQDLNSWVQNLSQVFASISAAWKVITDNEEALYTLMRKKSDANSKLLVSKYISHFKAFDEIINNLGHKITNEGHSDSAALDAKTRLSSFVSNYNMFFMEFVQTFFKFNEECMAMANDKLKEANLQAQMRQIATQSIQSRQKIKEFQEYIVKSSQNYKLFEKYNQYQMLDGIINQKNKEIQELRNKIFKQARHIEYITDYNSENVNYLLENENKFECFCGGAHLVYFSKIWEQKLKKGQNSDKNNHSKMQDQSQETKKQKVKEVHQLQLERQILIQRNTHLQAKCQKIKLQNKVSDEMVLQSPLYIHLRSQFKDLMDYANDLILKINKHNQYLGQIEKLRLEQIEQFKRKQQKSTLSVTKPQSHPQNVGGLSQNMAFKKFRQKIENNFFQLKSLFEASNQKIKQKQQNLQVTKDSLKYLKKQNDQLNRKINQYQEKQLKNIEHLQFRHQKFNELEKNINEIFKNLAQTEDMQKTRKVWDQYVEYVKTRDKKIKAMEEVMKKKDKEITQKQKVQEVMKNAMAETEEIYQKYKQKLDKFEEFISKNEKQIANLSEQNYRIKVELEQQKNVLNIRLKNEIQVKNKLEERVKAYEKIQAQTKTSRLLEAELQKMFQQLTTSQKQKINRLRMEVKEKERETQQLNQFLSEKDKTIEKLIEDKEKKNLENSKLYLQLNAKSQFEVLRREMEEYKTKIMCRCGADREREVVLKTCPHIFCKKCIDDTTANRNRKCPICSVRFTKTDIHEIVWT